MPRDTSASVTSSKRTRRRASTGCWTCRSRHIKCDGGRPSCRRCIRSDIPCEGYSMRLTWVTGSKHSNLEGSTGTASLETVTPPSREMIRPANFTHETEDPAPISQAVRHMAYEGLPKRHRGHMNEISSFAPTWPLDHYIEIINEFLPRPSILGTCESVERGSSESMNAGHLKFHITSMQPEKMEFLDSQGALLVTTGELRDQLLQAYMRWVHPQLPMLYMPEVLRAIIVEQETDFPNPLLYQAIMFAGSAFVDCQYIEAAGYRSRLELRKTLLLRAKLLYEFEAEAYPLPRVQALLLMSYWDDASDNLKDPSHWLAVAWKIALQTSLFKEGTEKSIKWRKLWRCFHIRDTLISLNLRKPAHIKSLSFEADYLSMEDFYPEAYDIKVLLAFPDSVPLLLSESQKLMFMMFLNTTQLCTRVHHVLEELYGNTSLNGRHQYDLSPSRSLDSPNIQHCIALMRNWIDNLPGTARYHPPVPLMSNPASVETITLVHQANLHIIYLTTSCALLHSISHINPDSQAQRLLRYSASKIIQMMKDLHVSGITSLLADTSVTAMTFATLIYSLDLRSPLKGLHHHALASSRICIWFLRELELAYPSARAALDFLLPRIEK